MAEPTRRSQLRVAVLECDAPLAAIQERYGSYGDIFGKLLQRGTHGADVCNKPEIVVSMWDVAGRRAYPQLADIDAIVISEANVDGNAEDAWILDLIMFVQDAYGSDVPIIGVCFGHQVVARALGATVGRSDSYEIPATKISLTPAGSSLFEDRQHLVLHQMHRDVVESVPAGCASIGSTARCQIHGLYQLHRILTLQGHPEFDQFMVERAASSRAEQGILSDDVAVDGIARAGLPHDGDVVAHTMVRFLVQGQISRQRVCLAGRHESVARR